MATVHETLPVRMQLGLINLILIILIIIFNNDCNFSLMAPVHGTKSVGPKRSGII